MWHCSQVITQTSRDHAEIPHDKADSEFPDVFHLQRNCSGFEPEIRGRSAPVLCCSKVFPAHN